MTTNPLSQITAHFTRPLRFRALDGRDVTIDLAKQEPTVHYEWSRQKGGRYWVDVVGGRTYVSKSEWDGVREGVK